MPLLRLYRLATIALTPCARPLLAWRAGRGKEDPSRLGERLGFPSLPRPHGQLVWLHGASLGESLSLLPLIERFIQRGIEVLVTTGTPGSARLLGARLPAGAFHQYLPLDAPRFVARFLDHWRPDLALFAESEIWPNFVGAVHARGAPLVLVNARISETSAERWRAAPGRRRQAFWQDRPLPRSRRRKRRAVSGSWRAPGASRRQSEIRRARAAGRSAKARGSPGRARRPPGFRGRLHPSGRGELGAGRSSRFGA